MAVPPTAKKKKSLASFFEHRTPTTTGTARTRKDTVEAELSSYLSVCVDRDADPLKWRRES